MKTLNLKNKVLAVGAGVALVAAAVSAAVTWDGDVVSTQNKTLNYAGVVTGSVAQQSDVTAAQSLVRFVSENATSSRAGSSEVCEMKEVPVEGTGTYSFSRKTAKDVAFVMGGGDWNESQSMKSAQVDGLMNLQSKSYRVDGKSYSTNMIEEIKFKSSPFFNDDEDVARLTAEFESEDDISYVLNFSSNIKFGSDSFTDNSSKDDIEIPFLGQMYKLYSMTSSNNKIDEIQLFSKDSLVQYSPGDKIEGLKGKDGKTYYVEVGQVTSGTNPQVLLSLYDSETGQLVREYANERVSSGRYAEDKLSSVVEVVEVLEFNLGANMPPEYRIEMAVGENALTLKNNKGFPYDSTETRNSNYNWKITLDSDNNQELKSITLSPMASSFDYTDEKGLAPGQEFSFYNDFARIHFVGLELPEFDAHNPQDVSVFKFVKSVDYGVGTAPGFMYVDSRDTEHAVPLYMKLNLTLDDGNLFYSEFEFDGVDYTMYFKKDTNKIGYDDGMLISSYDGAIDSNVRVLETTLGHVNLNDANFESSLILTLEDSESNDVNYRPIVYKRNENGYDLYLFFEDSLETKSGTLTLVGSDFNNSSNTFSANVDFYLPKHGFIRDITGSYDREDNFVASQFTFNALGLDHNFYVNNDQERLVRNDRGGSSTNVAFGGQVSIDGLSSKLNRGDDDEIVTAYDAKGTKVHVTSTYELEITVPEAPAKAKFWVYTPANAGELTGAEYETKEVCTTTTSTEPMPYAGVSSFSVLRDSEATSDGKYIVVGGWAVNNLFPEALTARLAKDGDVVSEVVNGHLVVAGYTAADTTRAVSELINLLTQDM